MRSSVASVASCSLSSWGLKRWRKATSARAAAAGSVMSSRLRLRPTTSCSSMLSRLSCLRSSSLGMRLVDHHSRQT